MNKILLLVILVFSGIGISNTYAFTIYNPRPVVIDDAGHAVPSVKTKILQPTKPQQTGNAAADALPTVSITSPSNYTVFNYPVTSGIVINATASASTGTISQVAFYNGSTLLGTVTSPSGGKGNQYAYTWNNPSMGRYTLTAIATQSDGETNTSVAVIVRVNYVNPDPMVYEPIVSLTSPNNNATYTAPANIMLNANASENGNGTISQVAFYNGTTLLGTSVTSPYSYTISNASVGTYTLTAVATDANSFSTTSTPVTVTVTGQPAVTMASPTNNSSFTTGSINITAIATENDGSISNVAFYNGTTLLGKVTSSSQAFTYSWINVPSGTYHLTAIATDILGTTVTSSPITVTFNAANYTTAVDDNIAANTDALNHTTNYQYDNDNRLLKTIFADGSTVSEGYDFFGNQISVTDQRGNTLRKTYDAYERLYQTKDPLGGTTQFNYDTNGDLLTLTDANGHATNYTYDGNYRVLSQSNALNFATVFTYDPVGNVASRMDANNKTTKYTYDALNRLTNIAYPDSTSVANIYDALGRKTSMTDATGQTNYTYDPLSRLLSKTSPGTNNVMTYTYDGEGNRLTSVDQNNRTITNAYDALNRLATVTDPNGTTTYGYDDVSNRTSVKSPNGVTESYTYDDLNRVLTAVNAKGSTIISSFSNVYDIAGMIKKKTLQDGSWTAYSYDALNRLLEETKRNNTSTIYDYVYTYDSVGNRLTWTKNTTLGGFWSTDYLNMPPQVLTNMTNANYGNTANPSQTTTLARNYTYDTANRLSNWNYAVNIYSSSFPIQTDTYTYDNNGNRLTKQVALTGASSNQQTTYSYDFENHLLSMSLPNASVGSPDMLSYVYNGEGLRTQAVLNSVTSAYLYDGSNILVERDSSGNTLKSYTRGLDFGGGIGSLINQATTGTNAAVQYYDFNDLGSTADLTTSTGTSAASYTYDAFGNLLTPQTTRDTNRYLFSTKEFDSRSGLDYFGARYYDPEIGRWLTPDPLGITTKLDKYTGEANEANIVRVNDNLYEYVENSPLTNVDYWGYQAVPVGQSSMSFSPPSQPPMSMNPPISPPSGGCPPSINTNNFNGGFTPEECKTILDAELAACFGIEDETQFWQCRARASENYSFCLGRV